MKKQTKIKKIFVGADHAGFYLKEALKSHFEKMDWDFVDCGNDRYDTNDDYPDFAATVARAVAAKKGTGLLICNSGVGVTIAANKISGIRAVNAATEKLAASSRHDDDTNVLCLGADQLNVAQAKRIFAAWVKAPFGTAPRYKRRVQKITALERKRK